MILKFFKALEMLNELVDESDPDLDLPNIVHAFQVITIFLSVHVYCIFSLCSLRLQRGSEQTTQTRSGCS